MDKQEAMRLTKQENTLLELGFTFEEAASLRRISNTLRRWYELECGTDNDGISVSIERDDKTGKPFRRVQYNACSIFPRAKNEWIDQKHPTPDRETGAIKRLDAIIKARNDRHYVQNTDYYGLTRDEVIPYLQTDPRGAALYILRPGDVPAGADPSAYYSRGICVF